MAEECVLLVEDEEVVRLSLARVLARAGYEAVVAANGAEALAFPATPPEKRAVG
jgi:CheY-like chemotaxis protein